MRPAKNVSRIVLALSGVLALLGLTAVAQAAVGKATFTVTGSPNSLTVQQGKGGTYQVSVNSVNGFVGDVSLALSGCRRAPPRPPPRSASLPAARRSRPSR